MTNTTSADFRREIRGQSGSYSSQPNYPGPKCIGYKARLADVFQQERFDSYSEYRPSRLLSVGSLDSFSIRRIVSGRSLQQTLRIDRGVV
jgi:hypothetical protein